MEASLPGLVPAATAAQAEPTAGVRQRAGPSGRSGGAPRQGDFSARPSRGLRLELGRFPGKTWTSAEPSAKSQIEEVLPTTLLECQLRCGNLGNPQWHNLCSRCFYFHTLLPVLHEEAALRVLRGAPAAAESAAPALVALAASHSGAARRAGEAEQDRVEACCVTIDDAPGTPSSAGGRSAGFAGLAPARVPGWRPARELSVVPISPLSPLAAAAADDCADAGAANARPAFIPCVTALEVVLLLLTVVVNEGLEPMGINPWLGPSVQTLYLCGGLLLRDHEYWRLLSAVFLHAGLWHAVSNLLMQWWIGRALELRWGLRWTAALYLLTGLGGNVLSANLSAPNTVSVGSSGAIHGLMAAGATAQDVRPWYPASVVEAFIAGNLRDWLGWRGLVLVLVGSLVGGLLSPGVDSWAHLGGAVAGVAVAAARTPRSSPWLTTARAGAVVTALAFFGACLYLLGCYDCLAPRGQVLDLLV